jgi:hyperosmotically inducible protein
MRLLILVALATLSAAACNSNPEQRPADKSVVPTADQAGQSTPDIATAQQIRKAIMRNSTLSTNAHNCKIIVNGGIVTLAGPVASADERAMVNSAAADIVGSTNVVDRLEVTN